MWVYTGTSLVNIAGAQEIVTDRENSSDRLTAYSVAADFGERARVFLARVEVVFSASLIVSLDAGADEPTLSPRERAERQAQDECAACLNSLAGALAAGQAFCDLSGLYTPVIMADT